jgi:hypothetical protein
MFRAVGALRPTKGCQRSEARPRERIKTAIRATRAMRHPNLWKAPPLLDTAETSTRGDGVEYATTTRQPLPCPPTISVCNDFAYAPGHASSSAVLAAAATAQGSSSHMRCVPWDGVCGATVVDSACSQATGDHNRAWSGDTRQSSATRRASLENVVEIDFYRRILDKMAECQCADWFESAQGALGQSLYGRPGRLGHASRRARAAARPRRASLCRDTGGLSG